ncbi:MAG: transcriptional regulator, PadR-like family [Solirubrobacterales bacterium]|jgi:DNA-binding PadR family transcriptional regulator|nr:transcriptional regulator, PadR-like family [Solirubrobacterales bacterium]
MQSPVNWALLGLVIERPSYAYELAQRFDRVYEGALSLSSTSHVYTALGTLQYRDLVEEVAGTRRGRQPRPRYRATTRGVSEYRDWLVGQFRDNRRRQRLFVLQLGSLTHDPDAALEMVARFEEACLEEAAKTPIGPPGGTSAEKDTNLVGRLLAEDSRLAVGARLAWVQYARRELVALTNSRRARA